MLGTFLGEDATGCGRRPERHSQFKQASFTLFLVRKDWLLVTDSSALKKHTFERRVQSIKHSMVPTLWTKFSLAQEAHPSHSDWEQMLQCTKAFGPYSQTGPPWD